MTLWNGCRTSCDLKYPNDAELLQITMSGEDIESSCRQIVNAVIQRLF